GDEIVGLNLTSSAKGEKVVSAANQSCLAAVLPIVRELWVREVGPLRRFQIREVNAGRLRAFPIYVPLVMRYVDATNRIPGLGWFVRNPNPKEAQNKNDQSDRGKKADHAGKSFHPKSTANLSPVIFEK